MEINQKKRLQSWLRKQLYGSDTKVEKITLHHVNSKGQQGPEIGVIKLEVTPKPGEEFDSLVAEIETSYSCDAEGLGDHQKYVVHACFTDEEKRRLVLSWTPVQDEYADPFNTEGATQGGLTGQAMRHAETFMKMTVMASGQNMVQLQRENQRLAEQNEKLHERVMEFSELVEDLRSRKHERELEAYQAETKNEIVRDIGNKISTVILPIFANRLAKGQLMKGTSPKEDLIKSLIEKMTPDQLTSIAGVLKPDQQVIMFELINSFDDSKKDDGDKNGVTT